MPSKYSSECGGIGKLKMATQSLLFLVLSAAHFDPFASLDLLSSSDYYLFKRGFVRPEKGEEITKHPEEAQNGERGYEK